jgi:hypothetical protein
MAALGLQTDLNDQNPLRNIFIFNKFILESGYDLVKFALICQSTMLRLNEALLNFAFEFRMGFNLV